MTTTNTMHLSIPALDAALDTEDTSVPGCVLRAYATTRRTSNPVLDFSHTLLDQDTDTLVEALRSLGINEFTISAPQTGMQETIHTLTQHGVRLAGITLVQTPHTPISGETELVPAFHLHID